MKNKILLYLPLILTFSSCKKEAARINNNTTNENTTNTLIADGLPANPNAVNGVFQAQKMFFPGLNNTFYWSSAGFHVTPKPMSHLNPYGAIIVGNENVDTVKINGTQLNFELSNPTSLYRYSDTTSNADYSAGVNWFIRGNSNFQTLNTSVTRGFPSISNTTFIPTSFSKSQTLTVNFGSGNITNADSITVLISSPSVGFHVTKTVLPTESFVTFSGAELSGAATGAGSNQVFVYVKNYSNMMVGGKMHVFIMHYDLGEFVNIMP